MHIALHQTVIQFLKDKYSDDFYLQVLNQANIDQSTFEAENYHNDTEVDAAIAAAGELLSQSRDEFLTDVGLHGAPGLMEAFKGYLEPDWNILDMVANVEDRMHRHVRQEMGAFPPALKSERINDSELKVSVLAHRKMAGLANGFILGFAKEYGNTVTIDIDETDNGYSFHITKTA